MRRLLTLLLLAVAITATATAYVPDTLTVTFLDVGQGDSILIQAPNGHAMLVDAGEASAASTVSARLNAEGVRLLHYVVATHEHDDHIGGMAVVTSLVSVGQIVTSGLQGSSFTALDFWTYLLTRGVPTHVAMAGETLALDPANVTVTVLNPPAAPGTDLNEASVVLRLVYGNQSFLLAGDAGTTAEGWMLASGRPLTAQILKVGHHGSNTATGTAFVAGVDPAVAVIEAVTSGHSGRDRGARLPASTAARTAAACRESVYIPAPAG